MLFNLWANILIISLLIQTTSRDCKDSSIQIVFNREITKNFLKNQERNQEITCFKSCSWMFPHQIYSELHFSKQIKWGRLRTGYYKPHKTFPGCWQIYKQSSAQAAITHNISEDSVPVQAASFICFPAAIPCSQWALFPSTISPQKTQIKPK